MRFLSIKQLLIQRYIRELDFLLFIFFINFILILFGLINNLFEALLFYLILCLNYVIIMAIFSITMVISFNLDKLFNGLTSPFL